MLRVQIGDFAAEKVADRYGPDRSSAGQPSEWDFLSVLLEAAHVGFQDFDNLPSNTHPRIRTLHIVDPFFGPVAITGVRLNSDVVEIADFEVDPDYWKVINDDPS